MVPTLKAREQEDIQLTVNSQYIAINEYLNNEFCMSKLMDILLATLVVLLS